MTARRQMIVDAIRAAGGHVTPNEIFRRVAAKAPAVNRTTVYRNLDLLCEMRLVVAAQIGGRMVYELASKAPHHHLICRTCDSIEALSHDAVQEWYDTVTRKHSFFIDMDHLMLFGECAKCRGVKAGSRGKVSHKKRSR